MERLDTTAARAMRALLANQPVSAAKITFVWKIAAGPTFARASTLAWSGDGTVAIQVKSEEWQREIRRLRPILIERMSMLLGPGVVRKIDVAYVPEDAPATEPQMFR